jgi:hypothetical protein
MVEQALPSTDPEFDAQVLASWRHEGRAIVAENHSEFRRLLVDVDREIAAGRLDRAAAAAQVAANYATFWHGGHFVSAGLERALQAIGERSASSDGRGRRPVDPRRGMKVLHVATEVVVMGGHGRMMARWISHDSDNCHSLALTRQWVEVPRGLHNAVTATGGRTAALNRDIGGLLAWARELQCLIAEADIVVLHVHNMDIVPFIALAGMRQRPPVMFVNHSDHSFWLGAGFSDLVVNTRVSGHRLSASRRGIEAGRNALMPLCLEPIARQASREAAKAALGLPPDSIVILTIARAVKFRAVGGQGFADALLPVMRRDPRVHLVVIGPGRAVGWGADAPDVAARITTFEERPDTAMFRDAADIYLDSFPFSSITSMFEAGLHELPLVTRNPFGAGCEIMGADSPGIDDNLIRARTTAEFHDHLARLIRDPAGRAEIGERTREAILATNTGEGWTQALHAMYAQALRLPRTRLADPSDDTAVFEDVDCFLPFVFGDIEAAPWPERKLAIARELALKVMPVGLRLQTWAALALHGRFVFRPTAQSWRYLVPEWIGSRLVDTLGRRRRSV